MSKERLEGVKKRLSAPSLKMGRMSGKTQLFNDLQWLIEQAERVQGLESENWVLRTVAESNKYISEQYFEQNKRYREAIEFGIKYLKNSDIRQVQLVVTALKSALEGEE